MHKIKSKPNYICAFTNVVFRISLESLKLEALERNGWNSSSIHHHLKTFNHFVISDPPSCYISVKKIIIQRLWHNLEQLAVSFRILQVLFLDFKVAFQSNSKFRSPPNTVSRYLFNWCEFPFYYYIQRLLQHSLV